MKATLSHVAILVRSIGGAAEICKAARWELGVVEDFPSEGTRELYVGADLNCGRLLLMEAIGPGPYAKALEKRGPGLHHIAVNVASITDYVASLSGSGWLLHPESLNSFEHRRTVYLARPGLKALIEVEESRPDERPRFISEVCIEGNAEQQSLLDALHVPGLRITERGEAEMAVSGMRIAISALVTP